MNKTLFVSAMLAASALTAFVPTSGAHLNDGACVDSQTTHIYYGPQGIVVALIVNGIPVGQGLSGVFVFDDCVGVQILGQDPVTGLTGLITCSIGQPTGDPLHDDGFDPAPVNNPNDPDNLWPFGNAPASSLLWVDTANGPENLLNANILPCWNTTLIGTGDDDANAGINGGRLPGGDYAADCLGATDHHQYGPGATYSAIEHLSPLGIAYDAGSDGPVVIPDADGTGNATVGPCENSGVVTDDYNTDPLDCQGNLAFDSGTGAVAYHSDSTLAAANWHNSATGTVPAVGPGSTGPQPGDSADLTAAFGNECEGFAGAVWVFIFPGVVQTSTGIFTSAPVVGDIQ